MSIAAIIVLAGALIFAAHFFAWLFSFTKIPAVLLLMLIGLLLGPWLGVLTPAFFGEAAQLWMTIVLVIILFEGGTKLHLDTLRSAWRNTTMLTVTNFVVTMLAVALLMRWLVGLEWILALMVGAILGGTSPEIVVPLLDHLRMGRSSRTVLFLESALSDVLSIVVTIALLDAFQAGVFQAEAVALNVAASFVLAAVLGGLGALIWSVIINRVRNVQNSIFMTPALVFILFGVAEYLGFSGLIAALAFGITMGNVGWLRSYLERKHEFLKLVFRPASLSRKERIFFSEAVFLLETFFFVYVGISIRLTSLWLVVFGLALTLFIFVLRIPVVRLAVSKDTAIADASLMAAIVPKGLAVAVLASLPLQRGIVEGRFIQELSYIVVLFSVVITSLLIFLLYKSRLVRVYRQLLSGFGIYRTWPGPDSDQTV